MYSLVASTIVSTLIEDFTKILELVTFITVGF